MSPVALLNSPFRFTDDFSVSGITCASSISTRPQSRRLDALERRCISRLQQRSSAGVLLLSSPLFVSSRSSSTRCSRYAKASLHWSAVCASIISYMIKSGTCIRVCVCTHVGSIWHTSFINLTSP